MGQDLTRNLRGKRKKRMTKEHSAPGCGGEHKNNEQHLGIAGMENPGQSGLQIPGWWPMLHEGQ